MYQQIKKGALALSLSLCCVGAFAQKTITGNVKDATGEPLIGVTIQAGKGGTVTDIDGNFSLQNLKPGDKITISYLGCKTQTITVGNQSALNIVMQSTDKSLDEVVVIGYGTMKRRDLTGAVASVTGDKLAQNHAPHQQQGTGCLCHGVSPQVQRIGILLVRQQAEWLPHHEPPVLL